jgi:hypothetical protein
MRKNKFIFIYLFTGVRVGNKKNIDLIFFFRSYEFLPTPELELFELEYSLAPESGIL